MTTFVEKKRMVVLKLESTSGTAETLAAADNNLRAFDINWDPEIEMWMNEFASGRHSKAQGVMGKKKMTVSFKHGMNLGASAAVAPLWGKALKACGALETVVALTSVAYTPSAVKDEGDGITATIAVILVPVSGNAIIATMKGAMGNCVISMDDLGQPLVAAFTFTGCFVAITDGSVLALTSPDTSIPPAVLGVASTSAGVTERIGKMSLDFGNNVQLDYSGGESSGYSAAYIAKRDPKWNWDPKAQLLATVPHYTRWAAGTEVALAVTTATVASLKWIVSAPKAQTKTNKPANRNEAITWDQEMELHESSGNDEFQILQN